MKSEIELDTNNPESLVTSFKYLTFQAPGEVSPVEHLALDEFHNSKHPLLAFYQAEERELHKEIPTKLYLVPTLDFVGLDFDEKSDREFLPQPTPKSELPDIEEWVGKFVVSVVEIWSDRRSAMQLSRWCHRQVHKQLVNRSAAITVAPKIRKIYISQPIEGVAETTVTLRIGERVRSLILRFEGVDKRWLCTELVLL
ncbi:MAG: Rv3235 family protein [Actinobacteria bacterium]|nr:Rv3235 family protein [Actinomycetota bacterium]